MKSQALKVLLVDDDANIRRTLKLLLKESHCLVSEAASVPQAGRALEAEPFDFILTDFRMGEQNGLDLISQVKKIQPQAIVVVMTAYASIENAVAVIKEGAFDYLAKPFTNAQFEHLLHKVKLFLDLKRENEGLKKQKQSREYFLGFTSPASRGLEEFVQKVAPTEATILLTGESGTGKSELARQIHNRSRRSQGPFVTVHGTTLAETLLESELFGHVKGAFTGAVSDKVGKLETARGGTLFLDEIGDLSPGAQARLLRFLQDHVLERVGGNQEITVDARIIAATNKKLSEAVSKGQFREDLYFRLNVFECHLAPLRERMEDLPVFLEHFFEEFKSLNLLEERPSLKPEILNILMSYGWPGNVRELKNVVERIILLSRGREVRAEDLPESVKNPAQTRTLETPPGFSLKEMEKKQIALVLSQEANLERAAEILGITPVTLWRKRKEYGLS